jgi:hypothetical protein
MSEERKKELKERKGKLERRIRYYSEPGCKHDPADKPGLEKELSKVNAELKKLGVNIRGPYKKSSPSTNNKIIQTLPESESESSPEPESESELTLQECLDNQRALEHTQTLLRLEKTTETFLKSHNDIRRDVNKLQKDLDNDRAENKRNRDEYLTIINDLKSENKRLREDVDNNRTEYLTTISELRAENRRLRNDLENYKAESSASIEDLRSENKLLREHQKMSNDRLTQEIKLLTDNNVQINSELERVYESYLKHFRKDGVTCLIANKQPPQSVHPLLNKY